MKTLKLMTTLPRCTTQISFNKYYYKAYPKVLNVPYHIHVFVFLNVCFFLSVAYLGFKN